MSGTNHSFLTLLVDWCKVQINVNHEAPVPQSALRARGLFLLGLLAVILLSVWVLLLRIDDTSFHGDESGWISTAGYYTQLLLSGELDWEKWRCKPCANWGSWLNPHLGQWMIGLPLTAVFSDDELDFFVFYDFKTDRAQNETEGRVPPPDTLQRARTVVALLSALSCGLVFAIAALTSRIWAGLLTVLILLPTPLFLTYSTRAMTDAHYSALLLGLCLVGVLIIQDRIRGKLPLTGVVFGIMGGLVTSIKIPGFLVASVFVVGLLTYKRYLSSAKTRELLLALVLYASTSLLVVYALNPYYWPTVGEIEIRPAAREIESFTTAWKTGDLPDNLRDEYPQLANLARLVEFPYTFVRWRNMADEQAVFFSTAKWGDSRVVTLHRRLLFEFAAFPGEWVLFLIGLGFGVRRVQESVLARQPSAVVIILLFFLVNYLFLLLVVSLNWERYYLSSVIAMRLFEGYGIYSVVQILGRWLSTRTPVSNSSTR